MGPKLVVFNCIIGESKDRKVDSVLSIAIKGLDNVVMATAVNPSDLSIESSARLFIKREAEKEY